mmetsp:Transcript_64/g.144  ORF Transcript_64/g.144 Transcript_64/m.144 type:complete len:409 (+) Transcript_64:294-1520(+)
MQILVGHLVDQMGGSVAAHDAVKQLRRRQLRRELLGGNRALLRQSCRVGHGLHHQGRRRRRRNQGWLRVGRLERGGLRVHLLDCGAWQQGAARKLLLKVAKMRLDNRDATKSRERAHALHAVLHALLDGRHAQRDVWRDGLNVLLHALDVLLYALHALDVRHRHLALKEMLAALHPHQRLKLRLGSGAQPKRGCELGESLAIGVHRRIRAEHVGCVLSHVLRSLLFLLLLRLSLQLGLVLCGLMRRQSRRCVARVALLLSLVVGVRRCCDPRVGRALLLRLLRPAVSHRHRRGRKALPVGGIQARNAEGCRLRLRGRVGRRGRIGRRWGRGCDNRATALAERVLKVLQVLRGQRRHGRLLAGAGTAVAQRLHHLVGGGKESAELLVSPPALLGLGILGGRGRGQALNA